MREEILERYVIPICSAEVIRESAHLRRLLGTAFFVDGNGTFLTANHVLQALDPNPPPNITYGLNVKSEQKPPTNLFVGLENWESAPSPYDIAIGKVSFRSTSWFEIAQEKPVSFWKDVATMGYPETALNTTTERFNIHMRMLKCYIQRLVNAGELQVRGRHPDCYELSFPITAGMSGAPLFTADRGKQQLIGICVGSYDAEVVDYISSEIDDEGKKFEERRVKIEQISIAETSVPTTETEAERSAARDPVSRHLTQHRVWGAHERYERGAGRSASFERIHDLADFRFPPSCFRSTPRTGHSI